MKINDEDTIALKSIIYCLSQEKDIREIKEHLLKISKDIPPSKISIMMEIIKTFNEDVLTSANTEMINHLANTLESSKKLDAKADFSNNLQDFELAYAFFVKSVKNVDAVSHELSLLYKCENTDDDMGEEEEPSPITP